MQTYWKVGIAMLASAGLGGLAVHAVHAQAKPPVYLVTEIDVTNPEAYGKEFAPKAQATIKAAGGRQLAIGGAGGAGAKPITVLGGEGTAPKRLVIQLWESADAMNKWYNSADYQEALKIGKQYATFRRLAVEGVAP